MSGRTRRNVVSLSVHRNTRERRQQRARRARIVREAKDCATIKDVAGFAIVCWNKDFDYKAVFGTGETMPGVLVPTFVAETIRREIGQWDADSVFHRIMGDNPDDDPDAA